MTAKYMKTKYLYITAANRKELNHPSSPACKYSAAVSYKSNIVHFLQEAAHVETLLVITQLKHSTDKIFTCNTKRYIYKVSNIVALLY
jgi:hypothetical protein